MVLLVSTTVFAAVVLAMAAIASFRSHSVRGRLHYYVNGERATADGRERGKPFQDEVLRPLLRRLGALVSRFTPAHVVSDLDRRLGQASYPFGLTVDSFLLVKTALPLALPIVYGVPLLMGGRGHVTLLQLLALGTWVFIGFRGPDWWLDHQVARRRQAVNRALPDALDLIVICTEAGLALEGAMARVVERIHGPLADDLRRTLGEISLGKRRRDALRALADRVEAQDLVAFVAAVVQADQTGISVGNVLRVQADDLRLRRRQRAEKEGRQAPLKMLVPNIFFIFPATLIVLIGPAGLKIADQMFGLTGGY